MDIGSGKIACINVYGQDVCYWGDDVTGMTACNYDRLCSKPRNIIEQIERAVTSSQYCSRILNDALPRERVQRARMYPLQKSSKIVPANTFEWFCTRAVSFA